MVLENLQHPSGYLMDSEPISIIDIGSNSVRLIVYEGARRSPAIIFNEKVLCGLGRDISSTGELNEKSTQRALDALRRFKAVSDQLGVIKIHPFATAAARDAKNSEDFVKKAEEICGCKIQILSGEKEAEMAAKGVIAGIHDADGLVIDMGGGSLEIIDVKKKNLKKAVTLPLGGLSLIDKNGGDKDQANKYVVKTLEAIKWLKVGKNRPIYAIGGTLRAISKLHMSQTNYPLRMVHEYAIEPNEILNFSNLIYHLSSTSLDGITELNKARRETVPYGAIVFKNMIELIRPSQIIFSSFGVREGVLYDLLSAEERSKDPLLAACRDLCALRSRSLQNSYELCDWTDQIFQKSHISETKEQKRLRHAVCLLSDIAWRTHTEYRGAHALNVIAQGSFSGINHEGRAFLALSVYFRHEGRVKSNKLPEISALLSEDMLKRARILGLAIRVAHMLSTCTTGVLGKTPLSFKDNKIILHLPEPYNILNGEKLARRLTSLAEMMELEADIQYGEKSRILELLGLG